MVTVKDAIAHGNLHVKNEPLTVEQIEKDLDQAIYKAIRYDQLPWVEAIVPYHISDEMLTEVFEQYKDAGWFSILAKRFVETKCDNNGITPNYYVISYTKFIFNYDSRTSTECLNFYRSQFNEPEWRRASNPKKK